MTGVPALLARAAICVVLLAAPAMADDLRPGENIVVQFDSVSTLGADAKSFAARLADERRRLRGWWGPEFEGEIRVMVQDDFRITMALIPAWRGSRGDLQVPTRRFLDGNAATLHEMTHIYAPNGNRFLAEGLAVYAHEKLGGVAAYPTFGRPLHGAAKPLAADADLVALDALATPQRLPDGDTSYTVAGSFVGFLIERFGMETFRALYAETPLAPETRIVSDPARWQKIYGKSLAALGEEWRAFLAGR